MSAIPPAPNLSGGFADDAPAPGGARRFVVTLLVAAILLAGVVVGMVYWMAATASPEYRGPEKLKEPDHPYYR